MPEPARRRGVNPVIGGRDIGPTKQPAQSASPAQVRALRVRADRRSGMKKVISMALAGVFLGSTMILPAEPASAEPRRDSFIERYYSERPRDDDYWRWRNDRRSWRDDDYRRWYRRHHHDYDGDDVAAGIFGLAAGAIIGGAIAGAASGGSGHVERCAARYRSYDPASDTYLGYDGYRHQCTL
jgi:hypothetical protein